MKNQRPIVIWLGTVCALILGIVVLGGITRLTGSGLSMVDWRPLMGVIPPLSEADWLATFERYKSSPQYLQTEISLAAFKRIFFWEYVHRLVGRIIGLAFLVPYLVFVWNGRLRKGLRGRIGLGFVLGGIQGLAGWYMVQSGLVDEPRVSHLRLAVHLTLALAILGYLLWIIFDLLRPRRGKFLSIPCAQIMAGFLAILMAQIIYGAFTAGLKAGYIYNTFPRMGEDWIPASAFALSPWLKNFFYNPAMVQFIHRLLGMVCLVLGLWAVVRAYRAGKGGRATQLFASFLILQVLLGIFTLLLGVPLMLGVLHQLNAALLMAASIYLFHRWGWRSAP